ncbi:MAG: hypothetical protein AAF433_14665 [Bacteroidota bacterium]
MPSTRHFLLTLSLLPLMGVMAQSNVGNVRVRAELNVEKMRIGDVCNLILNISAPAGTQVLATDLSPIQLAPNLEIRSSLPRTESATNPELLLREEYLLTSFTPGAVLIPALPITYELPDGRRDIAFSPSMTIVVEDIPVQGNEEVSPIKDIYREGFSIWDLWPLILGTSAGLLLLLGYSTLRRSKSWRRSRPAEVPAPHLQAYQELDLLAAEQLWQSGQLDPFYTRLSACLRRYLAGRFGIPALEQTTAETEQSLGRQVQLTDQQRMDLSQLLRSSDLVKFADQQLANADHQGQLEMVRAFVRRTEPQPITDSEEETV